MHRLLQGGGLVHHPAPQTQNIGFEKSPAISVVLYTRDSPRCSSLIVAKPKQNLVYLSIGEVGVRTVDRPWSVRTRPVAAKIEVNLSLFSRR